MKGQEPVPMAVDRPTPRTQLRLWRHVRVGDPGECWEWQGRSRLPTGYGRLKVDGRHVLAHRLALAIVEGSVPEGALVLHNCDNPPCCNPAHLRLGTKKDNGRDRAERHPYSWSVGEEHPRAVLTDELVRTARAAVAAGEPLAYVARRLGLGESGLRHAVQGRTWKHVA